jgi:ribonuclease HII
MERPRWLSERMAERAPAFFPFEEEGYASGHRYIAGVDEVGVGPLAGPVVAAAVILRRDRRHPEITDSKALAFKKRERLCEWIKENALAWSVGIVPPEQIDQLNILRATHLAMALAFKGLQPAPDCLLIDGSYLIPQQLLRDESYRLTAFPRQRAIKKGDRCCVSIAAASIVAKVTRDRLMAEYDRLYPEYRFAEHKGYSSRAHLEALRRYGPCPIHRRSYAAVRACIRVTEVASLPLFRR